MLQVIFFSIFLGISMLLIGEKRAQPMKNLFDSLNDVVLKMVDLIMLTAPYAVFALLASVVVSSDDPDILVALAQYAGVVLLGLALMIVFLHDYCFNRYKEKPILVFKRNQSCSIISVFNK